MFALNSSSTINATQRENDDLIYVIEEKPVDPKEIHSSTPKTGPLKISSAEFILFTSDFYYLGTTIDFLLDDTSDTKARIVKVTKAVGTLNFIWKSK